MGVAARLMPGVRARLDRASSDSPVIHDEFTVQCNKTYGVCKLQHTGTKAAQLSAAQRSAHTRC